MAYIIKMQNQIYYFAFLYEFIIWHGAKISEKTVRGSERTAYPENMNIKEGRTERARERKTLLLLNETAQTRQ